MRRLAIFILMIFMATTPASAQGLIQDLLAGRGASGRPLVHAPQPYRARPLDQRVFAPPRVARTPVRLASLAPDTPLRTAPSLRIPKPTADRRPAPAKRPPARLAALTPNVHIAPAAAPRPTARAAAALRDGDILVEPDGIKVFSSSQGSIAFEDANLPLAIKGNLAALAQAAPAAPNHTAPLAAALSNPAVPDGAIAPDGRSIRLIYR